MVPFDPKTYEKMSGVFLFCNKKPFHDRLEGMNDET